ncbi:MAG: hypothetical protein WC412_04310 [Candidatus Omnitrophota bacterium]|jgi:hypothetical protein
MFKSVRVDLEETLLQELDSIVNKLGELSDKGYAACSISRKDLINFAIASTFGLSYPYIPVSRKKRRK